MKKSNKFVQNNNNLAIAYYRFSSHSQNEASIDQQKEAAHLYAEKKGFTIIKEYEDRAISGTTEDRPAFQQMLSEVDIIKPAALILWKTDRLGRDRYTLVLAKKEIRDANCKIHLVAENIPDDSPEGALMEGLLESMAEFYSKQLQQNINRGLRYNAKNALFNGHNIIGYKKGEDKTYVIDPDKAPVVQKIFNDYASGIRMQQIADELNQQGITTSRGGNFTINSLRAILKNDRYIGIYRYADIVIEGGMPILISEELFEQVQSQFAKNKHKGSRIAYKVDTDNAPRYWLTGKLFCGECGHSFQGVSGTSKTKTTYYYYYCSEYRKKRCKKRPVRKEDIENLVMEVLSDFLKDTENLASLAVDAAAYYKNYYADSSYLKGLEAQQKETENALRNLVRAIEQGIFSDTTQKRLSDLESRKKALIAAIETEEVKKELTKDDHSIKTYFDKYCNVDFENPEVRDMILEYFVDKIYLYDDRLVITGKCSDSETEYELKWEELKNAVISKEFDDFVLGSTKYINQPPINWWFFIYRKVKCDIIKIHMRL